MIISTFDPFSVKSDRLLESRIRRDPDFRHQMIETYRKAFRDNPHLGEEFYVFLMKLGIQAEVRSQDES
jgi:hypothetical protein